MNSEAWLEFRSRFFSKVVLQHQQQSRAIFQTWACGKHGGKHGGGGHEPTEEPYSYPEASLNPGL